MKKLLFFLLILPLFSIASEPANAWSASAEYRKRFIENKGQFDPLIYGEHAPVLFTADLGKTKIFFTKRGVTYRFDHPVKNVDRKKGSPEPKYFANYEFVKMEWEGSNADVEIVAEGRTEDYFSYLLANGENLNYVKGYTKLVYKNLYPNIDAEYVFHPQDGIKYSFFLHPGADPSQIKMSWPDRQNIFVDDKGNLHIPTRFGDIIDHAPVSYDNKKNVIASSFNINGSAVSFELPAPLSLGRGVGGEVIDPWTQTPSFPGTNWDCVWECERDAAGNVYIIGGTSPMQLIKYNSAGAIQWTYNTPYDTTEWLGTFATDQAGNSYVTMGSPARIQKVSTAGAVVWNNANPGGIGLLTEFWNITFNCDQTRLIIGGTGPGLPPTPYIYNVDMNSGNITASAKVAGSGGITNDQEVRSVTSCGNSKYYFMSHDSIGFIHQSLTTCIQSGGTPFHTTSGANLSYKCENWRYNNSGIMALSWYNGFVFVNRGNQLQKRTFSNAAIVGTANIPGGSFTGGFGGNQVGNSGIDVDACGNIFVGSTNGVHKFDQNLNLLASYPTSFNVYDVEVNTGGDIIAAGSTGNSNSATRSGSVQVFAASACATQSLVCCDATICSASPVCNPGPAVTLTAGSPGGTWSGPGINPTTGVFDPTVAGNGTITITYTLPCGSESIQIIVKTCSPPVVCQESNGDLTVSGGSGPTYTWYQWNPGGTTPITNQAQCTACNPAYTWFFGQCLNGAFPVTTCSVAPGYQQFATGTTVTPPGTWPIQVLDGTGNFLTINSLAGIPPCSNIAISTVQTNPACNNQCTGTATVTATSGSSPFTYAWNTTPVQTTQVATGLCAGSYTVLVTDASSATSSALVVITQPAALSTSVTTSTASCSGSNGSATVNASGGTSGYTYLWTNGSSTNTATGLAAGIYSVTVTDANGCSTVTQANISNTGVPQANIISVNIPCNGGNNGVATVTVTVGTSPFTYSWSPGGQTTSSISGLAPGNYQVTVTDANGCIAIVSGSVTEPPALTASASGNNIACFGGTGSASVSQGGGTPSYSYLWTPGGQTGALATGLAAGNYAVAVTDANGCTTSQSVTITQPPAITASVTAGGTLCGASTGSASVTANGGTGSLTYNWTPGGQTTPAISNLAANTYTCVITDANGCTSVQTAVVPNLNGPTASITGQSNNICSTGAIGTATATATGGSAPYTYTWNTSPAQTGPVATGLSAGPYTVIVTDGTGCTNTQTITITSPAALTATVTTTPASCSNSDGTAALSVSGGTGSYTYQWSPLGGSSANASGLAAGSYQVLVTDANGCTQNVNVNIVSSNGPIALAGVSSTITPGSSVQLSSSGGVTYVWSPSAGLNDPNISNPVATPDQTTEYCVYVTDANGCTDSACITIIVLEPCTDDYYLPNAFSPNNDNENDVIKVYFKNLSCITEFRLAIYDRWGELVFETIDPDKGWNGVFELKSMDTQVMTYYLHVLFSSGTVVDKQGNITMLR